MIALSLVFFYCTSVNARLGDKPEFWKPFGSPVTRYSPEASWYCAAMNIRGNVVVAVPDGSPSIKAFQQDDNGNWNQLGDTLAQSATLLALSADGRTVILGNGRVPGGIVKVFSLSENNLWQQMGVSITGDSTPPSSDSTGSAFGISNDGKTIAVGSPGYSNGCGKVEVYDFASEWVLRGDAIECWNGTQWVGSVLSLSGAGDKLLVFDRVYEWITSSATWKQVGSDISGKPADQIFEETLSNDGRTVAIASPYSEANSRGIEVYAYSLNAAETQWEQLGDVISQPFPPSVGMLTKMSLNALGNTLLISWPFWRTDISSEYTGQARVFGLAGGEWKQIGQTLQKHNAPLAYVGENIAIDFDGNRVFYSWLNNSDKGREGLFQVYMKSS